MANRYGTPDQPGNTLAITGGAQNQKRLGSGSSALSVANTGTTAPFDIGSSITAALDRVYKITDRNTARSEQQAAELRDWQERQNRIAMEFNAAEAAKNRDWQEMMSNTAHQREIKDLQAAGLNPVLSAMGGNGAAVTSGATASGVTSSGSKGEVDTSLTQGLVSLLGTLWSSQTALESQRLNAQNNLAIAEKNNSTSELVARLYTEQAREASQLAAATGLSQAEISAATSRAVAATNYAATRYGADSAYAREELSTAISKEIAGMNIDASKRNLVFSEMNDMAQTVLGLRTQLETAGIHAQSALDVAKENHWNSMFGFNKAMGDQLASFLPSWIPGSKHESGRSRKR